MGALLTVALASCASSDDAGSGATRPDEDSVAYAAGQESARSSIERTGSTPTADRCATAFELLVSQGTQQSTNRTDCVAGCVEFKFRP